MAVSYSAEQKLGILKYAEKYGEKCASEKYNCTERSIFRWKNLYNGSLKSLENKYCAPYTHISFNWNNGTIKIVVWLH